MQEISQFNHLELSVTLNIKASLLRYSHITSLYSQGSYGKTKTIKQNLAYRDVND